MNRANKYIHNYPALLRYPQLDVATLGIVGYSDIAFKNVDYLFLQLVRTIYLVNANDNSIAIAFNSYSSRFVTRSVLAAEVIAFIDLIDEEFAFEDIIEITIANNVQLRLLMYSKSLFDIISKRSRSYRK